MTIEREGHDRAPPEQPVPWPPKPQKEEPHPRAPVDLRDESVAGEEDPGASLDVAVGAPAASPTPGKPAG